MHAPDGLAQTYRVPGQCLDVSTPTGDAAGLFAVASEPDSRGSFELLLRRGRAINDMLIDASFRAGSRLCARGIWGSGYPWQSAVGGDVLLVAVGSAIAPICALLEVLLKRRSAFGRIVAIYGERDVCDLAYGGRLAAWRANGVDVLPVLTRPSGDWSGAIGRVQEHCHGAMSNLSRDRSSAFICGMPAMINETAAHLASIGIPEHRIFNNQ